MYDSISKAAKKTGISAHTLRYYDREGLIPFIEHTSNGSRLFNEEDYEWLSVLQCLKNTGMSLKEIKTYMGWCMQGDSTLGKRLDFFEIQKKVIEKKSEELKRYEKIVNYKIDYLKERIAGAEKSHTSIF